MAKSAEFLDVSATHVKDLRKVQGHAARIDLDGFSAQVKTALQINYAVEQIINSAIRSVYNTDYILRQAVGVDTGSIFVARTGIRGSNDLVWAGPAANYAAKLCSLRDSYFASWITKRVFDKLNRTSSHSDQGFLMWEGRTWTDYNLAVYRSHWGWRL